ncbi:hypothetical protein AAFF_G00057330 [Aldrovandia affinis]|uniref:Uncharacterized protein n=1 Tax=Aldrovandia affinis TaxID=143900 RepID=A0AAD7S0R6_9TELE|nr:hypothetical protein AAFF_G00057330 [Aldrovandia affinis]
MEEHGEPLSERASGGVQSWEFTIPSNELQECSNVQCHHYGHQATPLHVSGHSNSDLRLRDVDEDSQHHQHVGCLHRRCLRTILRISWREHITNEEVMRRTGAALLSDMVSDRRRRLAGHVLRLPRERPASVAMDWVPEGGKRKRGRPKKTWRHTFKEDLSEMGVSWHGARRVASDRCRWRGLVAQCSSRNGRN